MKTVISIILVAITSLHMQQDPIVLRSDPPFQLRAWEGEQAHPVIVLEVASGITHFKPYKLHYNGAWHSLRQTVKGRQVRLRLDKPARGKDFVMHADPRKEVGNQPPRQQGLPEPGHDTNVPILAYFEGKALYYSKIVVSGH